MIAEREGKEKKVHRGQYKFNRNFMPVHNFELDGKLKLCLTAWGSWCAFKFAWQT